MAALVAAALCGAAAAPLPPAPEGRLQLALGQELNHALRETAALGVHILAVDSGETVYSYAGDEPRVPGSNAKLFTTAAALDALGAGYVFETRLLLRGQVQDGALAGDLGVVGGGDPNISGRAYDGDPYAVFRGWAHALAARGVRRVDGDIYLAHGLFEDLEIHPEWPREQLASWYEAPIAALSFNDNCVLVRVGPGRRGQPPHVETVPPVPLFKIENSARTTARRRRNHLNVYRHDDRLMVSGDIAENGDPLEVWVTVPDAVSYFGAALGDALGEEGIVVRGRLRAVPSLPGPAWERVAVYHSSLVETIRITNKRSQNFYAESLVKLLGAERCGDGSWRGGVRAVGEFLVGLGIPRGSFTMVDGSGMSRENRFTPRQVTQLLRHMYYHSWGSEFIQSLPSAGELGSSLHGRLTAPPYQGNVFAKTGTLAGVSALSGYARALSGRIYAFSILLNKTRDWPAHQAEDGIVRALIDNG